MVHTHPISPLCCLVPFMFQMALIFFPYMLHAQPIVLEIISTTKQHHVKRINHGINNNDIYPRPLITSNFWIHLFP